MSLINRMLQDLEQRQGQGGERGLLAGVRAVASRGSERRNGWWWVTLVVLLGIIVVLGWLLQTRHPVPGYPPVAVQSPVVPFAAPTPAPDLASLRLADIPAIPISAEAKKTELPPANRARASEESPEAVSPDRMSTGNIKGVEEARAAPSKSDSTGKRAEAIGVAPVKQISGQQQAEFLYQKAVALLQQGRMMEAQESLGESIRVAPDHAASRQALAGILVEKKQYAQAEQLLRDGLGRGGSQPEFAMAMARIQVERGDGRGAFETLHKTCRARRIMRATRLFWLLCCNARASTNWRSSTIWRHCDWLPPLPPRWWVSGFPCRRKTTRRKPRRRLAVPKRRVG